LRGESLNHDVWDLNRDNLGEGEKELWIHIETVLDDVLNELTGKDKIRVYFTNSESDHLWFLMENMQVIAQNYNMLINLAKEQERPAKFLKATSEFGFTDENSVFLTIQMTVLSCVIHTEMFKTFFLFHLKNVKDYRASSFNTIMAKNAPKTWGRLKPFVDNDFRNSLAHGTWAVINKKVVLFKDARLVPYERLELADFIIKAKKQNVLYSCLVNTITQRTRTDHFPDPHFFK
jgi:hypothetical protein